MPNNDLEIESLAKASDEYDQEQLDISLSGAIRKNPEQSAKAYNLAQQKGLPLDYVERNYDKASAPDISNVGPNVAQLLRDRKKSAIAYDDIDNLSWWEDAARETGNIGKIGLSGAYSISAAGYAGLGSTFNALSDITLAPDRYLLHLSTEDEIKDFDFLGAIGRKMMQFASGERAKAEAAMPTKTVINPAVMGGIKSVVMNAPALAAGVLARSPKVALGAMGGATYGDAYLTAKESGLNESSAVTYAANQAIAEVATESIPAARLLKDIGANAGFFKTIAAQMATEIPGEQVATIWQDALDWAALHPEKTLKEFIDERPDAAVNTLISTIVATGIQTGAIAGIDKLGRGKESEQIQAIADKANESKVNGRVPEIFSEHVQNVADEYGAPDAVYLDAKEARALFQSLEQDAAYKIIADQIDEAEAVGGDIVIPMGEFASKVATSPNFDKLKESFRLSPESPTISQASNQPERITALLKEAGDQVQIKNQADQIHKEVTDQLVATGRMNKDTAKASASIIPAYVTSMASRTGLPVDEVYGMMGLKIEPAKPNDDGGGQLLGQGPYENDLLAPLGESKMVGSETLIADYGDVKAFESDYKSATHRSIRYVKYDQEGNPIGVLQFRTKGPRSKSGEIQNVYTATSSRRTGVASGLLRRAQNDFKIKHSNDLTADGAAFKAADGKLYQLSQNTGDFRGSFDPKTGLMKLSEASDLTTFLHESGHLFLEMEARLFSHPNATEQMKADGQAILDWLGLDSFDQLKDYETNDVSREAHEKFARGFEKYLGEGKAPSVELKPVFRRFAAWLKQVYRDLRNLNVELNDEIRGVMDRMLATDEQINRARNVFEPLFSSAADAGMTEPEFKTYQMESSPDSAKEKLLAKMIKQLERQYTKWWKDESAVVAAEVRKDIAKEPLYSALEFMRGGATTKEAKTLTADIEQLEEQLRKITRANLTIKQTIARAGGINRKLAIDNGVDSEQVKKRFVSKGGSLFPATGGMSFDSIAELLNQEGYALDENGALDLVNSVLETDRFVDQDVQAQAENIESELQAKSTELGLSGSNKLNRDDVDSHFFGDIPGRFIGLTSANGMSADELAAIHGLASGSDLIDQINAEPTLNNKVKELTQSEMIKRHGDILNDGTIEEEAAQAIRNPEHAKKLMAELNALSRKTKQPTIDREAIKAYAKETIGSMAYSKIRPAQYRAAEIRAAREAAIAKNKGDFEAAQKAKQQEIINFYLSREATTQKEKAEKIRTSQKAIQVRKYSSSNIDMEHVNEAKILLGAYDFRKTSDSDKALAEANIARVRHWIESQQKDPNTIATFVQAEILGKLISYKEMTLDDLVGLDDTVKSILHAGRGLAEENKIEYRKNIDAGAASIKDNRIETYETEIDSSIPWVQVKNLFDEATASLRKLESFARQADGMNDQGWVWRNTVKPLLDAANEKLKRQAKSSDELKAIFKGFNGAFSNIKDIRSFTTESGKKIRLSYGSRLSMALNMGNEGNIDALKTMQSIPLTDNDISQIVGTLNESDWNLVQKVWDYIDTFWPEIAQLEIKRSGVAPQKVPGIPFMAPTGQQMKGGYYPLAGDSSADIKQLEQDVDTMASSMMNGGAASKSTKHGSTIERVGFGGKKIDFSIGVLFNHIDGVLHDLTHWQAVKDVDRVFKNEKISSELAVSLSKPGVKAMKQRLKEIAAGSQRIEGMGWINRILRHARMASTYSALGYSVRTALMNTMGLTTAIADMNAKQVARGAIEYYSNLSAMNSFILEKSEYMRDRGLVINRDIAQIKSRLKADDALTKIREGAFWMMTQTDKAITRPIWLAAYREGEMKFSTEKEAIDHADRMVARTQGSGMDLDLANVETRNELMKTMTVMYTAFSAIYNVSTEQIKRYKAGKIGATDLALKMAWLTIVPGILTQLITGSDDDEPEEYFWEILGQGLGMIPLVRDAYSYARYGASFPTPIMRLMSAPVKLAEQISQGEIDKGMIGAATELASWLHIPGGAQLTRSYGYLSNMQDGEIEEFSPIDLLITGKE